MTHISTEFGGKVNYYQLDFEVRNVKRGWTIQKIFESDPIKLIEPWELDEDVSEKIDKIAISDAHTHIERLVFPAFFVKNKETGERKLIHRCNDIHGKHTFMTHGGDRKTVYEPRVYERALRALQKETKE